VRASVLASVSETTRPGPTSGALAASALHLSAEQDHQDRQHRAAGKGDRRHQEEPLPGQRELLEARIGSRVFVLDQTKGGLGRVLRGGHGHRAATLSRAARSKDSHRCLR